MAKFIRRLQKIGSSILVSLPKEWIEANNLGKSNQVEIDTGDNTLSITVNKERPTRELVISYPLPKNENIVADLTGAYLLGYDIIRVKSKTKIPNEDREKIRESMRRLVGMEIVEEDSSNVNVQFLLDSSTLDPEKILKRMYSITYGMLHDVISGLTSEDKSNLQTISNRDIEVNRQYFLLVRLIRSTLIDQKLVTSFHLENIDVLDYRIAANIIENIGDTIVELSQAIILSSLSKMELEKIHENVSILESLAEKSIEAFVSHNRILAIDTIQSIKKYQEQISKLRAYLETSHKVPIEFLDMLYTFNRIARLWSDIVDLVKPIYN